VCLHELIRIQSDPLLVWPVVLPKARAKLPDLNLGLYLAIDTRDNRVMGMSCGVVRPTVLQLKPYTRSVSRRQ